MLPMKGFFSFLSGKKRNARVNGRPSQQQQQQEHGSGVVAHLSSLQVPDAHQRSLPSQKLSDPNDATGVIPRLHAVKDERTSMTLDVVHPGADLSEEPVKVTKTRKFHKPVIQRAEDVRTKQKVDLHIEQLHWHSSGNFSNVYRGKVVAPEKIEVAIKKSWPKHRSHETDMLVAIGRASPRNLIKLLYTFSNTSADGKYCEASVFAYMPETLDNVIGTGLSTRDMKCYTWQLFNGLDFLAANRIAHRDVKPINILVNRDTGELQIGDFGSAKVISTRERSSAYQVTRYYRPPEMLLGSNHYSHLIDVWSAGCVLGEMIKGRVLFRGSDSENQMQLIQGAFGTPSAHDLRAMRVDSVTVQRVPFTGLLSALGKGKGNYDLDTAASVAFLKRILKFDPQRRLCGPALLTDTYFNDVLRKHKRLLKRQPPECIPSAAFAQSMAASAVRVVQNQMKLAYGEDTRSMEESSSAEISEALYFPANGAQRAIRLASNSDYPLAYKIRTPANSHYRMLPVYGVIEALAETPLEILRMAGPCGEETMSVEWVRMPSYECDPSQEYELPRLFDDGSEGVLRVPLIANKNPFE